MRKFGIATVQLAVQFIFYFLIFSGFLYNDTHAAESSVYSVYRAIDLGESEHAPPKDIFIGMGADQGMKKGTVLDVYRRISSFDNMSQKLMGDNVIPVGRLKVIHVDEKTAIARLEKYVSVEQEPALLPQAIMIGDIVRLAE